MINTRSFFLTHIAHGLIVVAVAAALCLPFLLVGVPMGADSVDHVMYQHHFSQQFWNGDHYPRWLGEANKGYGSPIFLAQYPFPYFVTALLRPVLPFAPTGTREARELGVFCFLMLACAGMAAWLWFRNRCTPAASTIAAVVYMSLPYLFGLVLYDRTAIGELATFVWMPLLFALCDRAHAKRFAVLSALAVAFALLLMSNILTAVLFVPVLVLYAIASGRQTIGPVLLALAFGVCVAAVYLFPALAYQRLFAPGAFVLHRHFAQLGRNLLFVSSADMQIHRTAVPGILVTACLMLFIAYQIARSSGSNVARVCILLTLGLGTALLIPNWGPELIGWSGLTVSGFNTFAADSMNILFSALFTLGLGLLAYARISGRRTGPPEHVLLLISCGTFLFMLPWTAVLWRFLPKTDVIQFPWRLCSILTVAAAGLFALAIDDCFRQGASGQKKPSLRAILSVALVAICMGGFIWRLDIPFRHMRTPHVEVTRWLDPMYFAYVPASKLYAFASSVGASPDNYDVVSTPVKPGVSAEYTDGQGRVSVKRVTPEKLLVSAQCDGNARVKIGQLYFPLWKIVPEKGSPSSGESLGSSPEGLMEISLTPGQHEFWLVFGGGFPERFGAIVSLVSILIVAGGLLLTGWRGRTSKSHETALHDPNGTTD